jgi:hypothetical protein
VPGGRGRRARAELTGRLARVAVILALAVGPSGCVVLWRIPDILEETPSSSLAGLEYARYEGQTKYGERFQVRQALDVQARRRLRLVTVAGRVHESSWEDASADLDAAARVFGSATERSEAEVRAEFGAPTTVADTAQGQTWWYRRGRDGVFALLFRGGRLVAACRTTEPEFERLLAKSPPY